jgi:hypothetical protein
MNIKYTIFAKTYTNGKQLTPLGQIVADVSGNIVYISPALLNFEGEKVSLREILRRWSNIYHETHSEYVE